MNLVINWGAYIAITIRIATAILLLWQIIPLGIKESTVKNGLRRLRFQLLTIQFGLLVADLIAIWLIFETFEDNVGEFKTPGIQIVSAVILFIISLILYFIYHNQYTPQSRELHRRIDVVEKKRKYKDSK